MSTHAAQAQSHRRTPATYRFLTGVGGIGGGMFVAIRGNQTLGRNESRAGAILKQRDFCKLHIIAHYVAVLARRALEVYPIGRVGDDAAGRQLLQDMRHAGMDMRFVSTDPLAETLFSVVFTYPDGDGGNITTDDSASARLAPADVEAALGHLPAEGGIALAAPEVPLAARYRLLELARTRRWLTVAAFNSAEVPQAVRDGLLRHVDLLAMNRDEAAALAGCEAEDEAERIARLAGKAFAGFNPAGRLCVTAGGEGSFGWCDGRMEFTPVAPVQPVNTAGAGDATLSGLIVGTVAGLPFIDPQRPRRERLADAPLGTAMDLGAMLGGLAVVSEDTINFQACAGMIRQLAAGTGLDIKLLEPALSLE